MKFIFLLMLLGPVTLTAQETIQLDSCYFWTRKNYPNLKQIGLISEISNLKTDNIKAGWLPQVNLNAQISYQSDVPGIKIPIPNVSIPSVTKDQYKIYTEFRQTIWDGGLVAKNIKLEEKLLESNLHQVETELYKLNEQVLQLFFTAAVIQNQQFILNEQKKAILENLKVIESGIKNGTIEKSSRFVLEAEIINLDQNAVQLKAVELSALQVLSILTGKSITDKHKLFFLESIISEDINYLRPEFELFDSQNSQIKAQYELLEKSRYPKVFGFGQIGYGKPGLNMLNNKFDGYYLAGIGMSWNAMDWKKTNRQQQILKLQEQGVLSQKKTFEQNLEILLVQQKEQILKFEKLKEKDLEMIVLRHEILNSSESKFRNGAALVSDYIRDLQNETVAKLNLELHTLQLKEAKEKYRIIKGIK